MLVICMVLPALSATGNGLPVGHPAPDLDNVKLLQAPAGIKATWQSLNGKVVVIDFWATWCVPCRKSIPHWNQLVDEFKGKPVCFIAITDS